MNILFLGPSGSGKDTQADLLKDKGFINISTGELLRTEVKKNTELSIKINKFIDKGLWVPTEITFEILQNYLGVLGEVKNIIFNGAVREYDQVEFLDQILQKFSTKLDFVILFKLSKEVAIDRMKKRGRSDDTEEAIESRLNEFERSNRSIISAYSERKILHEIDASLTIEVIHKKIVEIIS